MVIEIPVLVNVFIVVIYLLVILGITYFLIRITAKRLPKNKKTEKDLFEYGKTIIGGIFSGLIVLIAADAKGVNLFSLEGSIRYLTLLLLLIIVLFIGIYAYICFTNQKPKPSKKS